MKSNLTKIVVKNSKWIDTDTSGIELLEVSSLHSLTQCIGYLKFIHKTEGNVVFRGQNKLYSTLVPSLYRGVKSITGIQRRNSLLANYIKQCNSKGNVFKAVSNYAQEPLLQHYGIKSKWIDLVDNIWVALWFGCYDFITNGKNHQQAHFQPRKILEHLYILCLLTSSNVESKDKPGYFVNDEIITIDLRKAVPSQYLRPHSQHALLARSKRLETISDIDMMNNVVGIIRVTVGDALSWLGQGDLLSPRNLFPPPHYDYGYGILLENAPVSSSNLGSVTYFFP